MKFKTEQSNSESPDVGTIAPIEEVVAVIETAVEKSSKSSISTDTKKEYLKIIKERINLIERSIDIIKESFHHIDEDYD